MLNINKLLEYDRLAREEGRKYNKKRIIYDAIAMDIGDHFIGIVGPRGTGKTIILKQLSAANKGSFYVSLDTLEGDLFELVKTLHETMKIKLFLLDEVHIYPHFEADLKKIYDVLHVRVIFTSSMALGMYESGYDLSRRVLLKSLYPFSLREYAKFKYGQEFSPLTLKNIVEKKIQTDVLKAGEHFQSYIQGGLMPFALREPQPLVLLENILKTIIRKDIPRIAKLLTDELDKIEQLVRFIGLSGIDGINYTSVSNNVHITKYKAGQYISLLERAFVLHQVFPKGSNVLKEPKVVMALPYRLLYRPFDEAVGGLREDFFVETFRALGKEVFYLKSLRGEKTPDYLVRDSEEIVFEVGGRNKGKKQFKGMGVKRKIIFSDGYDTTDIRRPLFLAGLIE
ncbi:MAG: ATP-binding protein [Candidatus Omnitrophica bacterium]|nr:ATP-binding protein [Candidatus Omnitrophota bacterium]